MSQSQVAFTKYTDSGAYHWRSTFVGGWRRSNPLSHARYDAALDGVDRYVPLRGSTGLDVGCGDGVMLYKISQRGGSAVGVDAEPSALTLAQASLADFSADGVVLTCADSFDLPLRDACVDFVTAIEIIEHLKEPARWIQEVRRVLRPGGVLAITTPQRRSDGALHDPFHEQEFDADGLRALLNPHMEVLSIRGQFYRPLVALYHRGSGIRPIDLVLRAGIKSAAVLRNPFRHTTPRPGIRWAGLLALARRVSAT